MKEKLLAALKLKFVGASDATLNRIASNKAGTVTEESQIEAVVEGITLDIVVQSEVDARIAEANKKAVQNYEETHKIKDGKPVEQHQQQQQSQQQQSSDMPEWAHKLIKQNEDLQQKLESQDKRSTQEKLSAALKQKLKDKKIPDAHISTLTAGRVLAEESEIETAVTEIEPLTMP